MKFKKIKEKAKKNKNYIIGGSAAVVLMVLVVFGVQPFTEFVWGETTPYVYSTNCSTLDLAITTVIDNTTEPGHLDMINFGYYNEEQLGIAGPCLIDVGDNQYTLIEVNSYTYEMSLVDQEDVADYINSVCVNEGGACKATLQVCAHFSDIPAAANESMARVVLTVDEYVEIPQTNVDANVTETCSDGIKNQDETGVDCGGVCDPCSGGNNGVDVNNTCEPSWYCTEWSNCTNFKQTRTCIDANECELEESTQTRDCVEEEDEKLAWDRIIIFLSILAVIIITVVVAVIYGKKKKR